MIHLKLQKNLIKLLSVLKICTADTALVRHIQIWW
jgi:hypothetical protein